MIRWFLYADLMHMMDCKGVAAIVFGAILARLSKDPALGTNIGVRLNLINEKLKDLYKCRPGSHRLPKIAQGNLFVNGWAVFHGPGIKAANTRAASGFVKDLSAEYLCHGSDFDKHMASVARLLDEFYSIIYAAPIFPTDDDIGRLRSVCIEFGESFMWCREFSRRDGCCGGRSFKGTQDAACAHDGCDHQPSVCAALCSGVAHWHHDQGLETLDVWSLEASCTECGADEALIGCAASDLHATPTMTCERESCS